MCACVCLGMFLYLCRDHLDVPIKSTQSDNPILEGTHGFNKNNKEK